MLSKDFKEILTGEMVSLTGGIVAGFLLTFATDKLYLLPGLFILFPGFMEMRGNIAGSLSARLTSGLYVGVMKYGHARKKIIKGNIVAAIVLSMAMGLFLGVLAYGFGYLAFGVSNTNIIIVSFAAAILANVIEIPLTVFTTLWLFKKGHDPSNIMGPYLTTVGDIVSVVALLVGIMVIG
jgi:mgtE-like transporter